MEKHLADVRTCSIFIFDNVKIIRRIEKFPLIFGIGAKILEESQQSLIIFRYLIMPVPIYKVDYVF